MLENIPTKQADHVLLRLTASRSAKAVFDSMFEGALDSQDLAEIRRLMPASKWSGDPWDAIRSQFEVRSAAPLSDQTRFSDGSKRVYYSALDLATTIEERLHWFRKESQPNQVVRLYLRLLQCDFAGSTKDLVPHANALSFLTSEDGYSQCNALANEAIACGVDALLTPSARRAGGTCVPVFGERSLSNPTFTSSHVFEFTPRGGNGYTAIEI